MRIGNGWIINRRHRLRLELGYINLLHLIRNVFKSNVHGNYSCFNFKSETSPCGVPARRGTPVVVIGRIVRCVIIFPVVVTTGSGVAR